MIAGMSQGQPARCTGITAFVRGVSMASMVAAVRFWLSGSMSAKTGFAPAITTVETLAK